MIEMKERRDVLLKRWFDLSVSLVLLLTLSPLLIIIAVMVRVNMGSPIIFKQQRPGLHGKPFYLYKFRTMTNQVDKTRNLLPDDQRVTPLGKFLRKYSLDELMQLINVIKGEISLVGPRPLLMEYLPLYTKEQAERHLVKPGITGWAQVNGRNAITWEEKFALDVWYVRYHSFLLDLKILLLTLYKVMRSDGVFDPRNGTVEKFQGSISSVKEGQR